MKWMLFFTAVFIYSFSYAQPSREEIRKFKIRKWTEIRTGDAGDAERTIFYDRKGNDSLELNGSETVVIKNVYKNGRLMEKVVLGADGKPGDKYIYQYNPDGSYKETYTDASFGMRSYEWYDKKGKLVKTQSPDGNTTSYKYDSKGKLLAVASDGKNDGIKINHRYIYNAKGQLIKAEKNVDGNKTLIEYEYDSKGRLAKQKERGTWEGEDFESSTENEYNEKGLVKKSMLKTKSPSTGTESKTKYEYGYEYY